MSTEEIICEIMSRVDIVSGGVRFPLIVQAIKVIRQ